jgi:hypothetical protein
MRGALPAWAVDAVSASAKNGELETLPEYRDSGYLSRPLTLGLKGERLLDPVRGRAYRRGTVW